MPELVPDIGPNPTVHGIITFGGRHLTDINNFPPPPPSNAFWSDSTTPLYEHCNVFNPNGQDYLMSGTPTFPLADGRMIFLSVHPQSGNVTLQDDSFLADTKLRLSSNRVSLGAGHAILLYCDGSLWYEIGRTPAVNRTRCIATGPDVIISPGQIVAACPAIGGDPASNVTRASARVGAGTLSNPIGASPGVGHFNGSLVDIQTSGEMHVPDKLWDSGVPALTDIGKRVYLSEGVYLPNDVPEVSDDVEAAGRWTMNAPTQKGATVVPMGTVTVGGPGSVMVLVKIGEPTLIPEIP